MNLPESVLTLLDSRRAPRSGVRLARGALLAGALVGFAFLYFFVATQLIHQTNLNRQKSDQQNNIEHTRIALGHMHPNVAETGFANALWQWFPHYTDGVVNPLWPWVSARLQKGANPTDHQIFVRGKWINVIVTGIFCLLCGVILARCCSLPAAVNGMFLIGFAALLPRAVYYQPEPLYFILFALCWLGCLYALHRNPIWIYALLGVLTGLAYLAKTSIQPLMISFVLVATYRFLQDMGCSVIGRGRWRRDCTEWQWNRHIVGLIFFGIIFLLTAGPRLNYANERFGNPFHSYPSYWMWMDSFPDGVVFMRKHSDKVALERLTDAERPSLKGYLASHEPRDSGARLADGFWWTWENLIAPPRARGDEKGTPEAPWRTLLPDRGIYLVSVLGLLLGLFVWYFAQRPKPENAAQRISPETSTAALFVVGCTLFYALAYGWYVPIGKGDRFMLALYTPLLLTLILGCEALLRRIQARGRGGAYAWCAYQAGHWVLFGFLGFRLLDLYRWPAFFEK